MSKKILRRAGFLAATLAAGIFSVAQAAEPIKVALSSL